MVMESPLKKDMKANGWKFKELKNKKEKKLNIKVDYEKKFYWIYHAYLEQHSFIKKIFEAWENQIHRSSVVSSLLIVISYLFGLLVGIFSVMRYLGKW